MTPRPYHHNNLRAVLLDQAAEVVRANGAESLSLRELARRAGVSHGAPRSHFIDRQALLDALAERGFQQLTDRVSSAIAGSGTTRQRFRAVCETYIAFAVEDAALMELMFASKLANADGAVQRAAAQLFTVLDEALEDPPPSGGDNARDRFKVLLAATLQGTATLIATRRVAGATSKQLVDDAIDLLLSSELGRQVLPERASESDVPHGSPPHPPDDHYQSEERPPDRDRLRG